MARPVHPGLVFVGCGSLAALGGILVLLDVPVLGCGLLAILATGAACLLLGPAMTVAMRLLESWMSSRF